MAQKPNTLDKFWQELKRRKVFGVVAPYAATAYIIIEITNNLAIPLHLPDWFASLELIILVIGLPVVIILSWVFDFTPGGIKKTESLEDLEKEEPLKGRAKRRLRPSYVLNGVLIIAVVILAYPKIFKPDTLKKIRSSGEKIAVAVLPFQNMTNDTIWDVWQDGIQNNMIDILTRGRELQIRQMESVTQIIQNEGLANLASITPSIAGTISDKLDADVFIQGSIKQAGSIIRINAQIVDSKTEETLKSFQTENSSGEEEIFKSIDSLSSMVKNYLVISDIAKGETIEYQPWEGSSFTKSPEAYRYAIYGLRAFSKKDYNAAINWYSKALAIDSIFFWPLNDITWAHMNLGLYEKAKVCCLNYYGKKDFMSMEEKAQADLTYSYIFEPLEKRIKYLKQLVDLDDNNTAYHFLLGNNYLNLEQYDQAISEYEKSMEYFKRTGTTIWGIDYEYLGYAYHKTGQYKKEKKLYRKAEKQLPDDLQIVVRQAVLSLTTGKTKETDKYIEKYVSLQRKNSTSDANITEVRVNSGLGGIYTEAGMLDKAEDYWRQALSLRPESKNMLNGVAWFLIDNDRNINDGLKYIDKALEIDSANYAFLDTKGWGLYKAGKHQEALDLLEKSWELKPVPYDHTINKHIEEVKKAIASQRN